jgi:hypothetical protein
MSTVENSPAVAPTPELPTESLAPTAGVIPTATPAATTIADAADMKLPLPAAPTPATSLPVAPLPITTMTTPARAERSARVVSARRDEAPTPRQQRRVHKERERVEVPAPRVFLPRDEPRSDVIPNPYHD